MGPLYAKLRAEGSRGMGAGKPYDSVCRACATLRRFGEVRVFVMAALCQWPIEEVR